MIKIGTSDLGLTLCSLARCQSGVRASSRAADGVAAAPPDAVSNKRHDISRQDAKVRKRTPRQSSSV